MPAKRDNAQDFYSYNTSVVIFRVKAKKPQPLRVILTSML